VIRSEQKAYRRAERRGATETGGPKRAQASRLVADAGYGSAEMSRVAGGRAGIEPHVKLMDKSERTDGTFSRSDFAYDPDRNLYVCPGGKELRNTTALSPSHARG
jgi:hypothetical protein